MDWIQVFTRGNRLFRKHQIQFAFHVWLFIDRDELVFEENLDLFLLLVAAVWIIQGAMGTL